MPFRVQHVRAVALVAALALLAASAADARVNPCAQARFRELLCPDLIMKRPSGLSLEHYEGHLLLRSTSSIDSVGAGPMEITGRRYRAGHMHVRQRIHRSSGGSILVKTGAELRFKQIPGQGGYWKLRDAARLEVWSVNSAGVQLQRVRVSPKLFYCLRDLQRTRPGRPGSPAE